MEFLRRGGGGEDLREYLFFRTKQQEMADKGRRKCDLKITASFIAFSDAIESDFLSCMPWLFTLRSRLLKGKGTEAQKI